jgi:hypothetical protein
MTDEPQALIQAIRAAFAGVPRGRVTIHEAEVMDVYGTAAERRTARLLDTEDTWDEVPDRDIEACTTALSHLDPEGWRYYLPAYMIWSLRHFRASRSLTSDQTIYALDFSDTNAEMQAYFGERARPLDLARSRAVCRFLQYMAENDDDADALAARRALDTYWSRFAESKGA